MAAGGGVVGIAVGFCAGSGSGAVFGASLGELERNGNENIAAKGDSRRAGEGRVLGPRSRMVS